MTNTPKPGMAEREHHAWGALLKYVEAIATMYRYDRYPKSSKTGKKIECFLTAARELRKQLAHEYGWVASEHLLPKDFSDREGHLNWGKARAEATRGDVYFGEELYELQQHVVFEIQSGPPERILKALGYTADERTRHHQAVRDILVQRAGGLIATSHPLLPSAPPRALLAEPQTPDRHEELRAALIENPDQPQAAFVKQCRVHPITVRKTRRELEEAGVIPFLPHRHGLGQRQVEPELEDAEAA